MRKIARIYNQSFDAARKYLEDFILLFIRLYVALAFFKSGQTKFSSWDSTLYLFESEYNVPLLPYELAAAMGTATELIVPIFLVLGLATRLNAAVLFFFNIIAVASYPALWEGGFFDHKLWGFMLLVTALWGAGKLSADTFLCKKFCG